MEELRGFTLAKLYEKISWTDEEFTEWLQHLKLIPTSRTCEECESKMTLQKLESGKNYPIWRCGKKTCRKKIGFLNGTFFEGTHLKLKEVR